MILSFKYNYNCEFFLKTHSEVTIDGNGEWYVDEEEFAIEYKAYSNKDFDEFLYEYLTSNLDLDPDYITFNEDDLLKLKEYCLHYLI